jgi:hypothetical protein
MALLEEGILQQALKNLFSGVVEQKRNLLLWRGAGLLPVCFH